MITKGDHCGDGEKSIQLHNFPDPPTHNGKRTLRHVEDGIQEDDQSHSNCWVRAVESLEIWTETFWAAHRLTVLTALKVLMVMLYLAFVSYSWYYRFGDEGSIILLVITSLLALRTLSKVLKASGVTRRLSKLMRRPLRKLSTNLVYIKFCLYPLTTLAIGLYLGLEVLPRNPRNIQSLIGIATFIAICFIFSTKPSQVNWHPVFWGCIIQISVAIITLRTEVGYSVFHWLGDAIRTFTNFSNSGAAFVFGKDFRSWGLLFQAGGMLVFFNSVISVLLHLGVIDAFVRVGGRAIAFCLGTGPVESVVAVTNIFLGQSEVILLTRPYLGVLTLSEFCAVMTCGYASVSGGLIGTFMAYGAPANHLLTAAVISAPAALAFAKLIMPETSKADHSAQGVVSMSGKDENRTVLSACSEGAMAAVGMVAAIISNMIAFYSIVMMFDEVIQWMGDRVGIEELGFEKVCGYLLYPLAYVMGVHPDDCFSVGALVGIKMFATPMTGFYELGQLIQNREKFENYLTTNSSWHKDGRDIILDATNTTLIKGVMQERSEVISTYAICGFSAFTALAIGVGGYFAVIPERKKDIMKVIPYGFIAGNIACFATGSVAGLMHSDM